jgi:hypothetical protein
MRVSKYLWIVLLVSVEAVGQENQPVWSTEVGYGIQWSYLSGETLIVARGDTATYHTTEFYTTLSGVDTSTGKIKWTFKPISESIITGADEVPNFPYLKLRGIPLTIINPSDGHLIVDGLTEQITTLYKYGFLESGHLWLDAAIDYGRGLSLFDLSTGQKLWTRYDYFGLSKKAEPTDIKAALLKAPGGDRQTLLCAPINDGNDQMVFATGDKISFNNLYKVSIATGDVVWKTDAPDRGNIDILKPEADTAFFRLIKGPQNFYYIKPKWITACSYENGKQVWKNLLRTGSKVGEVIHDKQNVILCSTTGDVNSPYSIGHFRLVNDSIGREVWSEALSITGGMSKYRNTQNGLAVVMENPEMALAPELAGSYLNYIDVAGGKYKMEEHVRLPGKIQNFQVVPKGVYYSTNRTLNIVDFDGKQLLDVPSHVTFQIEDSAKSWFYSDHNLYEINKTMATKRLVNTEKIADSPDYMENGANGMILYSNRYIKYINFDGTTRYVLSYKPITNWLEKNQLPALIKRPPEEKGQVLTQTQPTFQFIVFSKKGSDTYLSIINKDTGKVSSRITLRSNSGIPTYKTGANSIFFTTDSTVTAYSLR